RGAGAVSPAYQPIPEGVLCTSVTPFDRQGRFDLGAMRAHVEYVTASGCMGINVAGAGFGEGSLLTVDEVREIYRVTVEVGKGRIWCSAANIEHETAADCIAWARMAHEAGMDMVRVYPCDIGHTIVPTERMLEAFYKEVLDAVDFMPVMMSSNIITGF